MDDNNTFLVNLLVWSASWPVTTSHLKFQKLGGKKRKTLK